MSLTVILNGKQVDLQRARSMLPALFQALDLLHLSIIDQTTQQADLLLGARSHKLTLWRAVSQPDAPIHWAADVEIQYAGGWNYHRWNDIPSTFKDAIDRIASSLSDLPSEAGVTPVWSISRATPIVSHHERLRLEACRPRSEISS